MTGGSLKPSTVQCPTCGKPVAWVDSEEFRPFCSERCRLIDLGEWATGTYAIPCEPEDQGERDGEGTAN